MTDEIKEIYSVRASAGSRTYFFDVKQSRDGVRYLVISESKQTPSDYERHRIMVFEENLEIFCAAFDKTMEFLYAKKGGTVSEVTDNDAKADQKAYSIEKKRKEYPNAYAKWTPDEDNRLKDLYVKGTPIDELSRIFQRNRGAINSRLVGLGLTK